jgi:hypothetical protein
MAGRNGGAAISSRLPSFLLRGAGKLEAEMADVEQMPDDWDETKLGWYLMHRAEMFHRTADRLRRKAYEHALRTRRL